MGEGKGIRRPDPTPADDPGAFTAWPSAPHREFSFARSLFEVAIVAVGVLLALLVDEARQMRSDRALADDARIAMRTEIDQNRVRLATKLTLLHEAYRALEQDPAAGPVLVSQARNFQIPLGDTAWAMAIQTEALRLLDQDERQPLAYVYRSQDIYNQLVAEEMNRWTVLAAAGPDDPSIKIWKAYARRAAVGACIAVIRIERFRDRTLSPERMLRVCRTYQLSVPPRDLYRDMGLPMPNANWRPGGEF